MTVPGLFKLAISFLGDLQIIPEKLGRFVVQRKDSIFIIYQDIINPCTISFGAITRMSRSGMVMEEKEITSMGIRQLNVL